jgi:hypothetical protein
MYAVVIPATFNDRAAADQELGGLVDQIRAMPGFVAGYWLATSHDKGTALVVFENEPCAQKLVDIVLGMPHGSVTAGIVEVGEVLAHAER